MKVGKRGRAWNNARRKINKQNFENQITRCEQCGTESFLGNAHRAKRRKITTESELMKTVLLCAVCHELIEHLSPEGMKRAIDQIIETRAERYWAAC
jgi:hypothetical protein